MTLWRAKMNSMREDLRDGSRWDEARAFCRERRVLGLGWGRPGVLHHDSTAGDVLAEVERTWSRRATSSLRALIERMDDGDLVWTRDRRGAYWLGQITDEWHYDDSDEAWHWDINNVRPCQWVEKPLRDFQVPGSVVSSFAGPGTSLRRVPSEAAERVSRLIYEQATTGEPVPAFKPEEIINEHLLDPIDVEDVVLLLLQSRGWLLLPSTRMGSTPLYEAALRHPDDGRVAVAAVKSGANNYVPVSALIEEADRADWFDQIDLIYVFSTDGRYDGDLNDSRVVEIKPAELIELLRDKPQVLTPRISRWLQGE